MILTTSAQAGDVVTAYEYGADCYVVKPLDLDGFLDVVARVERFLLETAHLPATE